MTYVAPKKLEDRNDRNDHPFDPILENKFSLDTMRGPWPEGLVLVLGLGAGVAAEMFCLGQGRCQGPKTLQFRCFASPHISQVFTSLHP